MGRRPKNQVGASPTDEASTPRPVPKTEAAAASAPASKPPAKTPFYAASHSARYQRQAIIKRIQTDYERRLLCFVCGGATAIDRDDTLGLVDLLYNVPAQTDVDLLLHTGGGDIDAAEKLIVMIRNRVGTAKLRIIVPDFAKSAGTLIVLGADAVVMSDTSELGPIDPQFVLADGNGNRIQHSVQNYLDAYKEHSETLKKDPTDVAAKMMLAKLDPATVKLFEAVRARAQRFAEEQLKAGMFRAGNRNWSQTASELIDTTRWQSHGQMISHQDARSPKIDLTVEYLEPHSEQWRAYWQLYCMQRLAVKDREKLFEAELASLVVEGSVG